MAERAYTLSIEHWLEVRTLHPYLSKHALAETTKVTKFRHWSGTLLLSLRERDLGCSKVRQNSFEVRVVPAGGAD